MFGAAFSFFLTWWGAFLMAALDTTMLVFLPFGVDTLIIYLAARSRELFWLYPLLATAGSLAGAMVTFWIGEKAGEHRLDRLVRGKRLEQMRNKVRDRGAVATATAALLPPPFPLTAFILTCGAVAVDRRRFFVSFGLMRLLRFGIEAILARVYGRGIVRVLESDAFRFVVTGFIVLAVVGTIVSAIMLWRSTRHHRLRPA